ncbi:hypothetical protein GCM10009855_37470 [Gordonia cholesterolivorans]|uniref:Uncharacterized protein n=1 Tax=Gordonia cholesterolivorans TaxID=559625 RepID=A0ABN3I4R1_9ACTN
MRSDLDPHFTNAVLPARNVHSEYDYNEKQLVPHWPGSVLLDRSDTSPSGQTQVEPCDVARVENERLVLTHVKLGVKAADLSHLFSQGATSVELLNTAPESRAVLRELIEHRNPDFDLAPLERQDFKIEYVVVTKKVPDLRSDALPLFSRISLRRACRALASMKAEVSVYLAGDMYITQKRERPRKNKSDDVSSQED